MPQGTPISAEDRDTVVRMKENGIDEKNIAAAIGISLKSVNTILVATGVIEVKYKRQAESRPDIEFVHPEELGIDENWETQGLCRTGRYDPDLWFPSATDFSLIRLAQKVCYRCPVIMECRETAIARGEKNGIWGGLTELQRRRYRNGTHPSQLSEEELEKLERKEAG
jgi:WhiB family redox-sensing transcriptional regulator